jgi:hypothetical protein
MMKSRVFSWLLWNLVAWFLYMIIMDLILERAMEGENSRAKCAAYLMKVQHL